MRRVALEEPHVPWPVRAAEPLPEPLPESLPEPLPEPLCHQAPRGLHLGIGMREGPLHGAM